MHPSSMTAEQIQAESQRFMVKVYGWMSLALMITGFVAMFVASSTAILEVIIGNRLVFYGLLILQLGAVFYLAGWIGRMSASTATIIFIAYAALKGVTFSLIFVIYTAESIASTFFITAGTFAVMSIYGYTTKSDLSKWGNILFMGLIGLVIASVVNIFLQDEMLYWITTYAGVLIFVGLTAYDTQKIKATNIIGNEGTEEDSKEAVIGALTLYIDFVAMFLYLLRLFGDRK
jgi:FtsH-binding integral membrane protein